MNKEKLVRDAVELAITQGVRFKDGSPSFRPAGSDKIKQRFHVTILTNTSNNTSGYASIDEHFNVLEGYNEKSLANYFIDVFNGLNIEHKATRLS